MTDLPPIIEVRDAHVRFGEVVALDGVSLQIRPGECIGLVGHNGAGKSTIVNVINGGRTPDSGEISSDGASLNPYGINAARARGLRCVFQELSLCANLSIIENTRLMHRNLGGWTLTGGMFGNAGWRKRARTVIKKALDEVFPDHGIDPAVKVGTLSIAERQMVEIAMAFSDAGIAPRLVILDEPTSSLDAGLAAQLLQHVQRFTATGGAVVLISHILQEILTTSTRIVVMKDGLIVDARLAQDFDQTSLVAAMGSPVLEQAERRVHADREVVLSLPMPQGISFEARTGEIVGLAGLGGHGQTNMLLALFDTKSPQWLPRRDPRVTFVAGDRSLNGIFPLWSILRNFSIASLQDIARKGLLRDAGEVQRAAVWKERIGIRTPDLENPILSLSGGNQQKVLFARALGTRAPVVLMDDPMRGVDVGTKQEVYSIIRAEAEAGRSFVWYSTEMDEMQLCDRVYVFLNGRIVAELTGDEVTEHAILRASFRDDTDRADAA